MESADVKLAAQLLFRRRAQLLDFQLAHLVGQRLPGPDDVAVYFHYDIVFSFAGVVFEIVDNPLSAGFCTQCSSYFPNLIWLQTF